MSLTGSVFKKRIVGETLASKALRCGLASIFAASGALAGDTLTIEASGEGAAFEWHFPGILQSAATLTNDWSDRPKAVTSVTVPITNRCTFFRIRKPFFTVVDTGYTNCYNNLGPISPPSSGQAYYGQDPQYAGPAASYTNNGDGTITDLNTGLMWVQARGSKRVWEDGVAGAATNNTGGYTDWRMPTIKELYSLIQFSGLNGPTTDSTEGYVPFIDTNYFGFAYGPGTSTDIGDRVIDCQDWSGTEYVSTTQNGQPTVFGVNFADGRIKGYKKTVPSTGEDHTLYVRYVRGNPDYGTNLFVDNGDGTVTDLATALMWSQDDSGTGLNWEEALAYVHTVNASNHLGYSDWRLPNIKELQSLVDYTRSPDTTGTAAIDTDCFTCSGITNEAGKADFPYFWSSTILLDGGPSPSGTYISFGRAMGYSFGAWIDVHGAGSQKSDLLVGNPSIYPEGRGPQGDAVRIYNYVRLVRGGLNR